MDFPFERDLKQVPTAKRRPHPPHPATWWPSDFAWQAEGRLLRAEPLPKWLDCDSCRHGFRFERRGEYEYAVPCRCRTPHRLAKRLTRLALPLKADGQWPEHIDWRRMVDTEGRGIDDRISTWWGDWTPDSRGVLIYGPTGVGKTRLALAVALRIALSRDVDVRFLEWPEHFGAYASAARRRDGSDHALMERDIVAPDLLVLDELKAGNSWQVEHLERIVGARVERRRSTVITTNLIPGLTAANEHSIAAAFGDRVDSRLCSLRWLGMGGEDYRRVRV